jgi:hypothetical protein
LAPCLEDSESTEYTVHWLNELSKREEVEAEEEETAKARYAG